jgi:hypothetical protein
VEMGDLRLTKFVCRIASSQKNFKGDVVALVSDTESIAASAAPSPIHL